MPRIRRADIVAFRIDAHNLGDRLPPAAVTDAAGACGVQDTPPGSAAVALHARVRDLTAEALDDLIRHRKTLLRSWCMRGAPYLFPTADTAVFTTGVLPDDEPARRALLQGVEEALRTLDMDLEDAVARTSAQLRPVLGGSRLAIGELGAQIAARIAPGLPKTQRERWQAEGPYARGQPLGEGVVHFCLRILTLRRELCFAPRQGNQAPFVLLDEWLDTPPPDPAPDTAKAELARRYLRCHGPATPAGLASWLGVPDPAPWWRLIAPELHSVETDNGERWLLATDLDALRSPPPPSGVRLLPPHDPYTQLHDRETAVPDRTRHRAIWRSLHAPGTVLADGELVATWRSRKQGKTLAVEITPFTPIPTPHRRTIESEAQTLATLRGHPNATVTFT
ncbi:hypothetical protein HNP84_002911 [Thermocatellispora tengchongensis]|uniref:Winged helix DNA-binding domain-containing protein n=1 Tax=Thermocatellispora tengchongensis TaxID=1073253 RepID=A0A840P6W9_9ACTN|nr:winged helix DNA-binding domain-containing protein [Thermocatellispora tengchongensis]MBB5133190.1 hypothetical protein [Thermocatellispora tengchongensis]